LHETFLFQIILKSHITRLFFIIYTPCCSAM
jgi:hypothetical protein